MKKLYVSQFRFEEGHIDFEYNEVVDNIEHKLNIYFEFDKEVRPTNDAIACSISTLTGSAYDEIYIDLPISNEVLDKIKKFTNSTVVAPLDEKDEADVQVLQMHEGKIQKLKTFLNKKLTPINNKQVVDNEPVTILNFSGGFDSLAAIYLIPGNLKLVSVDFSGDFSREKAFFEKFHPFILKTNFRQEKLDRNSWTFMGVGALLYADYLKADYNVFGTIFEASKYQFMKKPSSAYNNSTPPFSFLGLKDIRYLNGLTEVGTVMVVTHYAPELVNDSLISLSYPKTEKRYRKETLLDIVCKKFKRDISFDRTEEPDYKTDFGKSLALDFLSLYVIKNMGVEKANKTVVNIPDEAISLCDKLNLDFYERLNCEFLCGTTFPDDSSRSYFMHRLLECGVLPYTENDYKEFRLVSDFLNRYHHIYS